MQKRNKKALAGSGKPARAHCMANHTMKTQVLYHKTGRKGKQEPPFYISRLDMGMLVLVFVFSIGAPFLAACI